jgi:hypothetical protein
MSDGRSLTVQLCHMAGHGLWYLEDGWSTLARGQGGGRKEGGREGGGRGLQSFERFLKTSQGVGMTFLNLEKGERSLTM